MEDQPDLHESDRYVWVEAERPANVKVTSRFDRARDVERGIQRDRPQGDTSARDKGLQQHVTGADRTTVTASGRMQSCLDQAASGRDRARDAVVE